MLEYIRNRAKGWFAWVIVGLITVPFALWGIHNYVGGGGPSYVAKVGGAEISQNHFENTYHQQRMQLEQMFGGQIPEMFSEQMLRAQVLEQMIDQEVLIQEGIKRRLTVSDRQLAQVIRGVDAFYEDGRFSQQLYVDLLRRQGMTPATFEQQLRRDLLAEQFELAFAATGFITPTSVEQILRLDLQQRELGWWHIPAAAFLPGITLSDDEIETWYQANTHRFQLPEQVSIDYLEIRADDIARQVVVDEAEIRIRYESRLDSYRSPEERRASHILIRVEEGASESAIRSARERADALLRQIRDGADFATLASNESEDPGSARRGGDLGFFGRGLMVPSFEDVAFALEPSQVSELVRSPFGFHIIRLEEVRGGEVRSFDEMRADIEREIRQELAARRFFELADRLATYTYEQPDTLAIAAEELGLTVQTSVPFTRQGGSGITAHRRVVEVAFGDDVLQRGANSDPIEVTRDHIVVLRLNAHQPARVRDLVEVREEVLEALRTERSRELAQQQAADMLARLDADEELAPLTADIHWQEPVLITRDSRDWDPAILEAAFAMPRPSSDAQPVLRQVSNARGDQFVLKLQGVIDGDPATADDAARSRAEQALLRSESAVIMDAMVSAIRDRTDITIRR